MSDDIKRMDIAEFREFGYLQELNRQFLHPLGLALEVRTYEDGTERLDGIWDYRDDPEGINFGDTVDMEERAKRVLRERVSRMKARSDALGYWVQPYRTSAKTDAPIATEPEVP